ncbi:MAG TPA: glycosyltransferase family 39 protein [Ignavibacteria bacterium]|nr:glycosyltransferase family 39 protein [Ignavibacteria bacterium]
MKSYYDSLISFLNRDRNKFLIFFALCVFLLIVKLPSLIATDIQPWDEGMYASRVLSIHTFGDFINQSEHSVGEFYSASHPPLLIWIGFLATKIFGASALVFKLIPFLFALGCLFLIINLSQKLFDLKTGILAALIFSSTIIFNVFAKRFQFDIPYTFFILLSFYLVVLFIESGKRKYIIYSGISFGLCLMTKILVGVFIPIVLFASWIVLQNKINLKLKDILLLTAIGVLIALPWHYYMISKYGSEFLQYFIGFHIMSRAFEGVEQNTKGSGYLYHVNYFFNILSFGILIFISMIKDLLSYKQLSWQKIFVWVWFITGLLIITLFKTKLEVYILFILTPGAVLLAHFILNYDFASRKINAFILFALIFNLVWFFTETNRTSLKQYFTSSDKLFILLIFFISVILIGWICYFLSDKLNIKKYLLYYAVFFFFANNIYFMLNVPRWDNTYAITPVYNKIFPDANELNTNFKNLIYISNNYTANPQFTFYFKGDDLGWDTHKYDYRLLDAKYGTEFIKNDLKDMNEKTYVIIQRDGINRNDSVDSKAVIPENFKFILSSPGYELYSNIND